MIHVECAMESVRQRWIDLPMRGRVREGYVAESVIDGWVHVGVDCTTVDVASTGPEGHVDQHVDQ